MANILEIYVLNKEPKIRLFLQRLLDKEFTNDSNIFLKTIKNIARYICVGTK